jgi:preprotein translocase subunit SecG
MEFFLLAIIFVSSILLILGILLHSPKGEGLGAIGGEARLYQVQKGVEAGLTRFTTIVAIIFFVSAGIFGVFF